MRTPLLLRQQSVGGHPAKPVRGDEREMLPVERPFVKGPSTTRPPTSTPTASQRLNDVTSDADNASSARRRIVNRWICRKPRV